MQLLGEEFKTSYELLEVVFKIVGHYILPISDDEVQKRYR